MSDDDWDTSAHTEEGGDPYNKSTFGTGASTSESASSASALSPSGESSVQASMEKLSVNDTSSSQQTSSEESAPPPPASESAPAPPEPPQAPVPPPAPEPPTVSVQQASSEASEPAKKVVTPPSGHGRKGSVPMDAPAFLQESATHKGEAFTEKLSPDALKFFNELCAKPFHEQAISFLNAYWDEIGSQAEFIFAVAYDKIKYADMHSKGVQYVHLYEEGNEMDFNIGLYFYEKLCQFVLDSDEGAKWRDNSEYALSMPTMMTAIKRKIELREKVDCNFDGKVSMLEYLLYQ